MIPLSVKDPRLQQVTSQMRHTWFVWGIVPLALCIVATLLVASAANDATEMTPMGLERRFQLLLALAAGLFLIGFSLDSHWTAAPKLARRLLLAAGLQPDSKGHFPKLTARQQQDLTQHSDLVFHSILSSVQALTIIGAAIGLVAVLAALAHLGLSYAVMLLILAAGYQLFVLSRHSYYREVMTAAAEGRLLHEQEDETTA
jgi:hypothetical protein